MTNRQIAEIARATRKTCSPNGMGNLIVLWADGSMSEATSANDTIARGAPGGGWEYPLARFSRPATMAMVREVIAEREDHRRTMEVSR